MNHASVQETEAAKKPPATLLIPAWVYADTWYDRPKWSYDPVLVGLRTIADADVQTARSQAAIYALQLHPRAREDEAERGFWSDAFNDALMRWVVARGTCDPNDVRDGCELWREAPEDMVREALRPEGVGFIYDAWERMRIASDPTQRVAGLDELVMAAGTLEENYPALLARDPVRAARVRKLLAFVFDELTA